MLNSLTQSANTQLLGNFLKESKKWNVISPFFNFLFFPNIFWISAKNAQRLATACNSSKLKKRKLNVDVCKAQIWGEGQTGEEFILSSSSLKTALWSVFSKPFKGIETEKRARANQRLSTGRISQLEDKILSLYRLCVSPLKSVWLDRRHKSWSVKHTAYPTASAPLLCAHNVKWWLLYTSGTIKKKLTIAINKAPSESFFKL